MVGRPDGERIGDAAADTGEVMENGDRGNLFLVVVETLELLEEEA